MEENILFTMKLILKFSGTKRYFNIKVKYYLNSTVIVLSATIITLYKRKIFYILFSIKHI